MTTMAGRVVVMSEVACERLCREYAVDRRKIVTIPHGASLPTQPRGKRTSRPIILTCGLLGPGKGAVSYTHLTLPTTRLVCRSRWSPYH